MESIKRALNELYKAVDDPSSLSKCVEDAIELLCNEIEETGSQMASNELSDVIQLLGDKDIESAIYELEVMENEL